MDFATQADGWVVWSRRGADWYDGWINLVVTKRDGRRMRRYHTAWNGHRFAVTADLNTAKAEYGERCFDELVKHLALVLKEPAHA